MEFRILGPLYADARTGDGPAVISQPLLQSTLAILLLRANRPCPRSLLIEALWGSEPPGSPEAALRVCVSRLRRSLGICAERLESVGPPGGSSPGHRQQRGYVMVVRPGELDVDEFTDLAEQGQAELDTGNPAAAANYLVQALALWGDPPLPDLPVTEVIRPAITRLKNLRQAAMDTLIDARLAAGEHDRVLGQLRAAALENPGRERTCAQLMKACHALGMRKEALDVYQLARQATLEQQGAEPGPVLAVLYRQILAEELAEPNRAIRRAGQVAAAGGLGGQQAPAPPADFVGRSAELAEVARNLTSQGTAITVLTGGPGSGKSAIASVAALQLREQFADGQLYVELGGLEHPRDPHQILGDLLQTLGIPGHDIPAARSARSAMYRSLLAGRKVLLIAEDAASAAQIRPLMPAAGGPAMLVTSRGRLTAVAGARVIEIGGLPADDGQRLLAAIAGRDRAAAEPAAARAVIRACGDLPLAIRLAATTIAARPGMTIASLAADLQNGRCLELLAAEDVSLRQAIGSSFNAASGHARNALCLAAVSIPGELPAWALAELADGHTSVPEQLVAVGLLSPAAVEAAGARFRLHPLTRAYVSVYEEERGLGGEKVLNRLRALWLFGTSCSFSELPALPFFTTDRSPAELADDIIPTPELANADRSWLECERANLTSAVMQAAAAGDLLTAQAIASRLTAYQCVTGAHHAAIAMWRDLAVCAPAPRDNLAAARAQYFLAFALAEDHAGVTEALTLLTQCAPTLEHLGDTASAAMAFGLLASCANLAKRHAAAIRACQRAMRLADESRPGDLVRAGARAVLGETLARVGSVGIGTACCQRAVREARQLREPEYEAFAVCALAAAHLSGGRYAAAADLCSTELDPAHSCRKAIRDRCGTILQIARGQITTKSS